MLKRRPVKPPKRACASASTWSSARAPAHRPGAARCGHRVAQPKRGRPALENFISTEQMPRCASTAFATRRFGDHTASEAVIARKKRGDAARVVGFLVGAEQERGIAVRRAAAAASRPRPRP
jgi:hypothetical protein